MRDKLCEGQALTQFGEIRKIKKSPYTRGFSKERQILIAGRKCKSLRRTGSRRRASSVGKVCVT